MSIVSCDNCQWFGPENELSTNMLVNGAAACPVCDTLLKGEEETAPPEPAPYDGPTYRVGIVEGMNEAAAEEEILDVIFDRLNNLEGGIVREGEYDIPCKVNVRVWLEEEAPPEEAPPTLFDRVEKMEEWFNRLRVFVDTDGAPPAELLARIVHLERDVRTLMARVGADEQEPCRRCGSTEWHHAALNDEEPWCSVCVSSIYRPESPSEKSSP